MTLLAHQAPPRRAAFTLIELMVVMAILTLMLTLLMSGVQRVRVAAKRNSAHTDIRELSQGVTLFKQKFNVDYIPSRIVLREDGAYVTNSPTDPNRNKLELDSINWLKTAWPFLTFPVDWNQNGSIQTNVAYDLEGDQCLVFFLGGIRDGGQLAGGFNLGGQPTGFSVNKRNPMDTSTSERIPPFIQFQTERLIRRDATTAGQVGFYSYVDPWKVPYAYFTSYGKQKGYMPYLEPSPSTTPMSDCYTLQVAPTRVFHYVDPATTKPKQADSFQIICAGEDKLFGAGGTNLPATGPGEDDIANFSQGTLGNAN